MADEGNELMDVTEDKVAQTKSLLIGADVLDVSYARRVRADYLESRPQLLVRAHLHSNGPRCLLETLHHLKRFDGVLNSSRPMRPA